MCSITPPAYLEALNNTCVDLVKGISGGGEGDGEGDGDGEGGKVMDENVMCFGLSAKGKLYVGELLMKAGVNSFSVNLEMGMLLYVTVGECKAT